MTTRPLFPLGLALLGAAGCQSYFPNYGPGMYSAFPPPPSSYAPASPTSPRSPTYDPARGSPSAGQTNLGTSNPGTTIKGAGTPAAGQNNPPNTVPNYRDPTSIKSPAGSGRGDVPKNLGAGDEEDDGLRPTSRRDKGPSRLEGLSDDIGDELSQTDFAAPREVEQASAVEEIQETPRVTRKSMRGLFKHGDGYSFLRGLAVRDPRGQGWRLKYSDDPTDEDPYGGTLTIIGNRNLELLKDDDTIHVEGEIDPTMPDRYGKPAYRVRELKWVKRREE